MAILFCTFTIFLILFTVWSYLYVYWGTHVEMSRYEFEYNKYVAKKRIYITFKMFKEHFEKLEKKYTILHDSHYKNNIQSVEKINFISAIYIHANIVRIEHVVLAFDPISFIKFRFWQKKYINKLTKRGDFI